MKTEILFPEVANLCGDLMNVTYLRQCCPEMEVVETGLKDRPAFLDGGVDLVYVGSATERGLQLMVKALAPYRAELERYVDGSGLMLATGNALDALGEYVVIDGKRAFDGLGILKTHAEYHMMKRHNSFLLGSYQDMEIVGFKSLFGFHYDAAEAEGWFDTVRGVGRTPESKPEGFRRGGLYATALIGPLLPLNPPLCKWLLRQMGAEDTLAFEDAAFASFNKRVAEFKEPGRSFQYS